MGKNAFHNQFMFNIQENENETTGNYDLIDMKQQMQVEQNEEEAKKMGRRNTTMKKRKSSKVAGARESLQSSDYHSIIDDGISSRNEQRRDKGLYSHEDLVDTPDANELEEKPATPFGQIKDPRPSFSINRDPHQHLVAPKQNFQIKRRKTRVLPKKDDEY